MPSDVVRDTTPREVTPSNSQYDLSPSGLWNYRGQNRPFTADLASFSARSWRKDWPLCPNSELLGNTCRGWALGCLTSFGHGGPGKLALRRIRE